MDEGFIFAMGSDFFLSVCALAAKYYRHLLVHFKINLLVKLQNEMIIFMTVNWIDFLKGDRLN